MKINTLALGIISILMISGIIAGSVKVNASPDTVNYGDVTLSGGFQTGHFLDWWNLTDDDLVLSFTYDANGLIDDFGGSAHAWAELGVRSPCYSDFNPTWMTGGSGVWLSTDYDWAANTFDPDPPGAPTLDLDDKLILQRGGGMDESYYDIPSSPPNPWANHAVWFDRDGVDPFQALMWGAIDGVTYNTGGTYDIVIALHATSDTTGEAYMTVNGEDQGFYVPGWHSGPLVPPTDLYPAGMAFTGDMEHLRVFYGLYGYGATHSVTFSDITVEGILGEPPMAPCFERSIDIKPGSDPNSINLKSKGKVPVAILTTDDFDASTVDPDTVKFAGAHSVKWAFEDVDGDGDDDMILHFKTPELDLDTSSTEAYLTGFNSDGEFIWGKDTVNIVPKGKGPK